MRDSGHEHSLRRSGVRDSAPWRLLLAVLAVCAAVLTTATPLQAQMFPGAPSAAPEPEPPAATLPETLTPEDVDSLLARLTDADIRALLRDELTRRAEAQTEAETEAPASLRDRISDAMKLISARFSNWADKVTRLGERSERVAERLAMGTGGPQGVLLSAAALVLSAALAAVVSYRLAAGWRRWLLDTDGVDYWDRALRAVAMTLVELIPVIAFSVTIWLITPLLGRLLGPLHGGGVSYVWIFQTGVAYGWMIIILSRRVNAA